MMFFRNHAEKIFDGIVSLALFALTALVFAQVVSRYIFNSPISWTEEMARILFVWICFWPSKRKAISPLKRCCTAFSMPKQEAIFQPPPIS
jgi:hypothetical protein